MKTLEEQVITAMEEDPPLQARFHDAPVSTPSLAITWLFAPNAHRSLALDVTVAVRWATTGLLPISAQETVESYPEAWPELPPLGNSEANSVVEMTKKRG